MNRPFYNPGINRQIPPERRLDSGIARSAPFTMFRQTRPIR
jgi:hypothetical protein